MRNLHLHIAGLLVALLLIASPLSAHHQAGVYDREHVTTVDGTVTQVEFVNPHTRIRVQVKEDDGETYEWVVETAPPVMLRRIGWDKDSLKRGDEVTISGFRARNGSRHMSVRKLVLPNGQVLNQRER
jgi:hypothetical protein